jgi:DnaK suppressor protein
MDPAAIEKTLRRREQELLEGISRFDAQARESRSAEVEDTIDQAISSEGKAAAFSESTIASQTLREVRDALERLKDGSYGVCIDCGRRIEPARLGAIPWTPYCRQDQERRERGAAAGLGS